MPRYSNLRRPLRTAKVGACREWHQPRPSLETLYSSSSLHIALSRSNGSNQRTHPKTIWPAEKNPNTQKLNPPCRIGRPGTRFGQRQCGAWQKQLGPQTSPPQKMADSPEDPSLQEQSQCSQQKP